MASIAGNMSKTQAPRTLVLDQNRVALEETTVTGIVTGGIFGLLGLDGITLAALYAGIEPHPPAAVAPFIGATIAAGLFALPLVRDGKRSGYAAAILFAALSIVGFGPHKFFLENGTEIFPAVIAGFALSCAIIAAGVIALRSRTA